MSHTKAGINPLKEISTQPKRRMQRLNKVAIVNDLQYKSGADIKRFPQDDLRCLPHTTVNFGRPPVTKHRRRRTDQKKSAAAPTNCRWRRRGAAGARF